MVICEEDVEELRDRVLGQAHCLELVSVPRHVVGAAALEVEEGRDGLVRAHEGGVARVGIGTCGHGRLQVLVIFVADETLCLRPVQATAQPLNLFLHLGMLAPLANALEVGLDLAVQLEAVTSRAAVKRVLNDIAPQLEK